MPGLEKVRKMSGKGLEKLWKFIFKTAKKPCKWKLFNSLLFLRKLRHGSFFEKWQCSSMTCNFESL